MYNYIRIIMLSFIFVTIIWALSRTKRNNKEIKVLFAIIIFNIFTFLLYNLPFENLFTSFETIESVVKYLGKDNYKTIVMEGKESAILFHAESNTSYEIEVIYKKDGKYKLPTIGVPEVDRKISTPRGDILIWHVKNTNDYYLRISWITNLDLKSIVFNNKQLDIRKSVMNGKIIIEAEAYLEQYPNGNCLEIDGVKVDF